MPRNELLRSRTCAQRIEELRFSVRFVPLPHRPNPTEKLQLFFSACSQKV